MTPEDFLKLHKETDGEPDGFTVVEDGEWTQDHKYQQRDVVYREDSTGRCFCVCESRSGSYHTDWYYDDPTCIEVWPHAVTKTVYKGVPPA